MSEHASESTGSRTDIGRVRPHNEDSLIVTPPVYAVADGMGGHEAGEIASEVAVETLAVHAPRHPDPQGLARAFKAANRAVFRAVSEGRGKAGMGTTLTAAIVEGTQIVVAHVGDSRAYLLHQGVLQRITRDHSLVADLIEQGRITEAEARYHPNRSVITRALGSDANMQADVYEVDASHGDRLLLCTDGLSGMIEDERIAHILKSVADPQEACEALIVAANEAGGHDNITAIVVDIVGGEHLLRKRRTKKAVVATILWSLTAVSLAVAALFGVRAYAQNSAFLIEENGTVQVYQGLPGSVAGIAFKWPTSIESTVSAETLPASLQLRLKDGLRQPSVAAAARVLEEYRQYADSALMREEPSEEPEDGGPQGPEQPETDAQP